MNFAYISFSDGVCRRLRARTEPEQVEEAITACEATNRTATLLGEDLTVLAEVVREPRALNGLIVLKR